MLCKTCWFIVPELVFFLWNRSEGVVWAPRGGNEVGQYWTKYWRIFLFIASSPLTSVMCNVSLVRINKLQNEGMKKKGTRCKVSNLPFLIFDMKVTSSQQILSFLVSDVKTLEPRSCEIRSMKGLERRPTNPRLVSVEHLEISKTVLYGLSQNSNFSK